MLMEHPAPLARRQFASDNYSGICPEAWQALVDANAGHALPYGEDSWTARASNLLRDLFETDCEVFFVFNGTAANSLALATLCQSYHSIICHQLAHVETDECGAPEFFSNGTKLLTIGGPNAKLEPRAVHGMARKRSDLHFPKPKAVSITQATELGTVYTVPEIEALGETCRHLGLHLHMDGARFANACASLGASPKALTWQAGVEVLCFGGTKNGMGLGEAVVFFNRKLAEEFPFRCKQAGQLASKMRYMSAPWVGMLEEGAWLRHAERANAMAARLEQRLRALPGVTLIAPRMVNSVFVNLPPGISQRLWSEGWRFYNFIGAGGARLMCSWDTTEEDVDQLADAITRALSDVA